MDKKRIHEMLEYMTEACLSEMKTKGIAAIDTKEMSDAIDMVKDLADAEKSVWEKCYYEKIVEAMKDEEEFEEALLKQMIREHGEVEGRMGYDRWRTSRGRFAPKGHGHETSMAKATGRAGFTPEPWPNPPYYDDPRLWDGKYAMDVMGYPDDGTRRDATRSDSRTSTAGRMGYTPNTDMARSMNQTGTARDGRQSYDEARRHFHESGGSQESKMKMDEKGREYVDEAITTMRDIFVDADPKMQKKMQDDLARLYREFGGK